MTTPSDVFPPRATAERGAVKAVFLVGFMGAGKTSVGQALAAAIGWRFVDLDARIVAKGGRSVANIFQQEGETFFRQMETNELRSVLGEIEASNTVVSLGGGAWMQQNNVNILRETSHPVLFLDAPVGELWRRCVPEQGMRPLLQSQDEFHQLYEARRMAYRNGTLRVETLGRSVDDVAQHIGLLLGLAGTNATP